MEDEIYSLLLAASQQFEEHQVKSNTVDPPTTSTSCSYVASRRVTRSQTSVASVRFTVPVSEKDLQAKVLEAVPQKTRQQTKWAHGIWMSWRLNRIKIAETPDECPSNLAEMSKANLCKWLSRFIVEIRRNDGKPYTGNTLHQILHLDFLLCR